jgi:ankyrin repeat protein
MVKKNTLEAQFFNAIERGKINDVKALLDKGVNINVKDETSDKCSAIYLAVAYNHHDIVELLINNGAKIDVANVEKQTPLMLASMKGHLNMVRLLLDNGANPASKNIAGANSLHIAAGHHHVEVVKELLDRGCPINSTINNGCTALSVASRCGALGVAQELLNRGADVNTTSKSKYTPLIYATFTANIDIVKLLIKQGADVTQKTNDKHNALLIASGLGDQYFESERRIDAQQTHFEGARKPTEEEYLVIVKELLKHLQINDIYETDNFGYNALSYAFEAGFLKVLNTFYLYDVLYSIIKKEDCKERSFNTSKLGYGIILEKNEANFNSLMKFFNSQADVDFCKDIITSHIHKNFKDIYNFPKRKKEILKFLDELNFNEDELTQHPKKEFIKPLSIALLNCKNDLDHPTNIINVSNKESEAYKFFEAIIDNEIDQIEKMLNEGTDINIKDDVGGTAIFYATYFANIELIEFLMNKGANINLSDKAGNTPFIHAAIQGDLELVKFLHSKEANINHINNFNENALFLAIENKNSNLSNFLIDLGLKLDLINKNRDSLLIIAANYGCTDTVKKLCSLGVQKDLKVNHVASQKETALHVAAHGGYNEIIDILCSYGANVNQQDKNKETPLHIATSKSNLEAVKILCSYNANPNIPAKDKYTPFAIATTQKNFAIIKELCLHGADINVTIKYNLTPIMLLTVYGELESVKYLCNLGANLKIITPETNSNVLDIAIQKNKIDVVKFLLSIGLDINISQGVKYSSLLHAMVNGRVEIFKILLEQSKNSKSTLKSDLFKFIETRINDVKSLFSEDLPPLLLEQQSQKRDKIKLIISNIIKETLKSFLLKESDFKIGAKNIVTMLEKAKLDDIAHLIKLYNAFSTLLVGKADKYAFINNVNHTQDILFLKDLTVSYYKSRFGEGVDKSKLNEELSKLKLDLSKCSSNSELFAKLFNAHIDRAHKELEVLIEHELSELNIPQSTILSKEENIAITQKYGKEFLSKAIIAKTDQSLKLLIENFGLDSLPKSKEVLEKIITTPILLKILENKYLDLELLVRNLDNIVTEANSITKQIGNISAEELIFIMQAKKGDLVENNSLKLSDKVIVYAATEILLNGTDASVSIMIEHYKQQISSVAKEIYTSIIRYGNPQAISRLCQKIILDIESEEAVKLLELSLSGDNKKAIFLELVKYLGAKLSAEQVIELTNKAYEASTLTNNNNTEANKKFAKEIFNALLDSHDKTNFNEFITTLAKLADIAKEKYLINFVKPYLLNVSSEVTVATPKKIISNNENSPPKPQQVKPFGHKKKQKNLSHQEKEKADPQKPEKTNESSNLQKSLNDVELSQNKQKASLPPQIQQKLHKIAQDDTKAFNIVGNFSSLSEQRKISNKKIKSSEKILLIENIKSYAVTLEDIYNKNSKDLSLEQFNCLKYNLLKLGESLYKLNTLFPKKGELINNSVIDIEDAKQIRDAMRHNLSLLRDENIEKFIPIFEALIRNNLLTKKLNSLQSNVDSKPIKLDLDRLGFKVTKVDPVKCSDKELYSLIKTELEKIKFFYEPYRKIKPDGEQLIIAVEGQEAIDAIKMKICTIGTYVTALTDVYKVKVSPNLYKFRELANKIAHEVQESEEYDLEQFSLFEELQSSEVIKVAENIDQTLANENGIQALAYLVASDDVSSESILGNNNPIISNEETDVTSDSELGGALLDTNADLL